ncbi:MAG: hypothetical protein HY619_01135 [Thaumarchaeota archaeon]|nr:hypothetical protein [Nitrososphaerota archaeon]
MVVVSIELCDGTPGFVEADLDYWIDSVKSYCPWAGQIIAAGRDSEMEAPVKLTVTLDKTSYVKGDEMTTTVSNPSSKRLVFSNSVYGLFFEAKTGESWKHYDAVIGNEVTTFLETGEQATIRYMLGESGPNPFDPGEYRVVLMGTAEREKRSVTAGAVFNVS